MINHCAKRSAIAIVIFFVFSTIAFSQIEQLGNNIEQKLDVVFDRSDNLDKTAIASVMQLNQHTIYKNTFGFANLEFSIPFSSNTKFSTGAIGKQIIALATLLAEDLKFISLDDDLIEYIPEVSDIAADIKIKHLISHSSGLHEIGQLKRLSGMQEEEEYSLSQILKLLNKQKKLDYSVGTFHLERTTNFILLAEVISRATKMPFSTFANQHIFTPLKMSNSSFVENHGTVLSNKADKYLQVEGKYMKRSSSVSYINASSFYSTLDDIEIFMNNWKEQIVGSPEMHKKLIQNILHDDGSPVNYGITTPTFSQRSKYMWNGLPVMYQISNDNGFTSSYYSFPDANFSSFVVTNNSEPYNGTYTWRSVDIILEKYMQDNKLELLENIASINLDNSTIKKYEGLYFSKEFGTFNRYFLKNDTLRSGNPNVGGDRLYVPIGKNKFQLMSPYNIKIEFETANNIKTLAFTINDTPKPNGFSVSYPEYQIEDKDRQDYIGEFYCEQLDLTFLINSENHQLTGSIKHHGDINLMPIFKDLFYSEKPNFHSFNFIRNEANQVIAFELNYNRNNIIWFDKKK